MQEPVTLKVFNAMGEEIATLVNEEQISGTHSVVFNSDNVQNGIFFYHLSAGKFSQTGKMIVVK